MNENNADINEQTDNASTNPFQDLVNSSFFFRLNLRLLLFFAVVGGIAAFVAGMMLRACSVV